jgi:hypothetical protein
LQEPKLQVLQLPERRLLELQLLVLQLPVLEQRQGQQQPEQELPPELVPQQLELGQQVTLLLLELQRLHHRQRLREQPRPLRSHPH